MSFKSDNNFIVDEGIVHLFCTISDFSLGEQKIRFLMSRIAVSDIFCLAAAGEFNRFHNSQADLHPRVKMGEESLARWENAVVENVSVVEKILPALYPTFVLPRQDLVSDSIALHEFIKTYEDVD